MTEVERFFRRLVSTLASRDPARLQGPLSLDDVTGSILPYRAHRRALQLDTVEDYEAVLLRLCAGEGDLVWTEPEEARKRFEVECRSPNPDLAALYAFENVLLTVRPEPLLWAIAPDPRADQPATGPVLEELAFEGDAVPQDEPEPMLVLGAARLEVPRRAEEADATGPDASGTGESGDDVADDPSIRPSCLYCGGSLPTHRAVNFCPHCGQSQTQILCPECRSEVEPGWRHCVNCGAAVGEA